MRITRKNDSHPSIVTIATATEPVRGYPSLLPGLDEATDNATLLDGELTLVQGPPKSGRTRKLLDIAAYNTTFGILQDGGATLIAVADRHPAFVLEELRRREFAGEATLRDHVRIAAVRTSADLALFVATVVAAGVSPSLLLIDDLGLLDLSPEGREDYHAKAARTAKTLAFGSLASAVQYATDAPYGAFAGVNLAAASVRPFPVVATVRAPRDGSRWGSSAAVMNADNVFGLDGTVLKSRRVRPVA